MQKAVKIDEKKNGIVLDIGLYECFSVVDSILPPNS